MNYSGKVMKQFGNFFSFDLIGQNPTCPLGRANQSPFFNSSNFAIFNMHHFEVV
jgi:hypothetical protein